MNHEVPMDVDAQAAMMARRRKRTPAMSQDSAFMSRMEAAHRRLITTPAVHQRMMTDSEMRCMMEHAGGVAMQRRDAGAPIGDEFPATVGQAEFGASATADRFHTVLASGNRAAMEAPLTPGDAVLEGGNMSPATSTSRTTSPATPVPRGHFAGVALPSHRRRR